jgi:hypothetical protein
VVVEGEAGGVDQDDHGDQPLEVPVLHDLPRPLRAAGERRVKQA